MAGIYANGIVTIAASDAEVATMGFLDIKYDSMALKENVWGEVFIRCIPMCVISFILY